MLKRLLALTALISLVVTLPLLAVAEHVDVRDGDDTRGLLDVRTVKVAGSERPTWQIITFSGWEAGRLWDKGYFLVRLDTFGGARYDYYALVRSNGDRMKATLVRDRQNKRDLTVSRLRAWHPTRSSVKVRVPLWKMRLGRRRVEYLWQVQSLFSDKDCVRICIDDVPDHVGIAEPIPGLPQPTPSVTPTVVPSNSPSPTPDDRADP